MSNNETTSAAAEPVGVDLLPDEGAMCDAELAPAPAAADAAQDTAEVEARVEVCENGAPVAAQASPDAEMLARCVAESICKLLPDLDKEPRVNAVVIQDMIEGAFWSGSKARIFLLSEDESLLQFPRGDAWKFLCRRFGSPVNVDEVIKVLSACKPMKPKERAEERGKVEKAVEDVVINFLQYENQRDHVEWTVDMFAPRSRMEILPEVARIIMTHKALAAKGQADPELVEDYRQHFPMIDKTLEYIIASRFALDRKKSYLWLWATSDWGKGFLLGILRDLGIVVEMSVKEIEATFEGKAVGRRPEDFKRAMILAVDEFKAVKSELKQLQSEIQLAPKFQLTSRVEIYTKLFLSAESVDSLVGERGVEDQFANRMSMLRGAGTLNDRAVYAQDQGRYYRAIRSYVAGKLNGLIEEYRALGREGAELRADAYLNAFLAENGLGTHFQRLSDSIDEIAVDAIDWMRSIAYAAPTGGKGAPEGTKAAPATISIQQDGEDEYLMFAGRALDDFLAARFTKTEIATLSRRRHEIMLAMSDDGRGNTNHRIDGRQAKSIKLRK